MNSAICLQAARHPCCEGEWGEGGGCASAEMCAGSDRVPRAPTARRACVPTPTSTGDARLWGMERAAIGARRAGTGRPHRGRPFEPVRAASAADPPPRSRADRGNQMGRGGCAHFGCSCVCRVALELAWCCASRGSNCGTFWPAATVDAKKPVAPKPKKGWWPLLYLDPLPLPAYNSGAAARNANCATADPPSNHYRASSDAARPDGAARRPRALGGATLCRGGGGEHRRRRAGEHHAQPHHLHQHLTVTTASARAAASAAAAAAARRRIIVIFFTTTAAVPHRRVDARVRSVGARRRGGARPRRWCRFAPPRRHGRPLCAQPLVGHARNQGPLAPSSPRRRRTWTCT